MKYEPLAKTLIATSLALSCLMAHAASVAPVAAVFQHIDADMGSHMLGGDHHAVLGGNRGHRSGVGHQAAQCQ